MGGVFISYRRADSQASTGRLSDRLKQLLGPSTPIFVDIDSIRPGEDFREVIADTLARCDVTLVMIGPRWIDLTGDDGERRLDDPEDLVRLEVESALASDRATIPVLVEGAAMPAPQDLPVSIRELSSLHAAEVATSRFVADTEFLGALVRGHLTAPSRTGWLARWGSALLLLVAVALVIVLGGALDPSFDDPTGGGTVEVATLDPATATVDEPLLIDTAGDIAVTVDGLVAAAEVQLRFDLASIPLGATEWTALEGGRATVEPGVTEWTPTGAVGGEVRVRDADGAILATRHFAADVDSTWYLTVMGAVMVIALLAGFAYVESGVRMVRRGRRGAAAYASAAFGGALLAFALVLASAAIRTTHVSLATLVVSVILVTAAAVGLTHLVATPARVGGR